MAYEGKSKAGFNNASLFVNEPEKFEEYGSALSGVVKMADGKEYWISFKLSQGLPEELIEDLVTLLNVAQGETVNRRPLFYGSLRIKQR